MIRIQKRLKNVRQDFKKYVVTFSEDNLKISLVFFRKYYVFYSLVWTPTTIYLRYMMVDRGDRDSTGWTVQEV